MRYFKKIISAILVLSLVLAQMSIFAFAAGSNPTISAESAIIYGDSGEVFFEKNADAKMEPASMTKLLTCLIAVEKLKLNETVIIDTEVEAVEPIELGLVEGEEISVEDLPYASLLLSGNDAATALAIKVSGSVDEFAKLMNDKAESIGCKNTNFTNPSGLPDDNQYTTARDMAIIAKAAFANETIRKISGTIEYTVPATNMSEKREVNNFNLFLKGAKFDYEGTEIKVEKYKGVFGGKTGTLSDEYTTMVTGVKLEGMEIYCVTMGSHFNNRFKDMKELLDYAKASISKYVAFKKGAEFDKVRLKGGAVNRVMAVAASEGFVNLPEGASASLVTTKCVYSDELKAPIEKGQKIGVAEIYIADDLVSKVDLVAKEDVVEGWFLSFMGISNFQTILIGVVLALILSFVMTILYLRIQNKKKRQAIRKKKLMEEAKKQLEREEDLRRRNWHF